MSLATRCTQCSTIFKVVEDQLKVSEGWVRCGRCHEIFNALEGLFDLERDPPPMRRTPHPAGGAQRPASSERAAAPGTNIGARVQPAPATSTEWTDTTPQAPAPSPPLPAPAPAATDDLPAFLLKPRPIGVPPATAAAAAEPMRPMPQQEPPPSMPATPEPDALASPPPRHPLAPPATEVPSTHEDDALDSRWLMSPTRDGRSASERLNREAHTDDFADAEFPQDVAEDLAADDWSAQDAGAKAAASAAATPPSAADTPGGSSRGKGKPSKKKARRSLPADAPDFVKRAERRAQWQRPAVRATLAAVSLLLVALLALQSAFHFRATLAARWPETAPALVAMCELAACTVGAPLVDDALVVESNKLSVPIGASAGVYKLSLLLRNKAGYAVAAPHVELTLKDESENLIARRTMALSDLGYPSDVLPEGETELQVLLESTARISGYTVGVFYP